jgi:MoaA/NifB/PqqE/SkfB family radical SAM enzyme
MCFFSKEGYKENFIGPMDIDLFNKIAKDIFPRTRMLFMGCGAEPLMSPQFAEYAESIRAYSIPFVCLVTNGQLINEKIGSSVIHNSFNQVIVSVDGARKETYESIRAGANFEKLISNLRLLNDLKKEYKSRRPDLRINYVAMRRNIDEIEKLIDISSELNVSTIRVRSLGDWGGAIDYRNEILPPEMYASAVERAANYAKRKNIEVLFEGMYSPRENEDRKDPYKPYECVSPWYNLFIRGDGKVRFCTHQPFEHGDLTFQTFKGIEASHKVKSMRKLLKENPNASCLNICQRRFSRL